MTDVTMWILVVSTIGVLVLSVWEHYIRPVIQFAFGVSVGPEISIYNWNAVSKVYIVLLAVFLFLLINEIAARYP